VGGEGSGSALIPRKNETHGTNVTHKGVWPSQGQANAKGRGVFEVWNPVMSGGRGGYRHILGSVNMKGTERGKKKLGTYTGAWNKGGGDYQVNETGGRSWEAWGREIIRSQSWEP